MEEVWVAETWQAHGEGHDVHGVYGSREAAFEALKALPNMTVYVDAAGCVRGRPAKERQAPFVPTGWRSWVNQPPERWACAKPMKVQGRMSIIQAE